MAQLLHSLPSPSHPQLLHPSARRFWAHLPHAFTFTARQACPSPARSSSAFQGTSLHTQALLLTEHLLSQPEELLFARAEPSCAQWEGGRQSWVAEAQLGCSGEVQAQVGFVLAFPIPAPFCLKQAEQHTRCPCVPLRVPVSCPVSQSRDKRHLPDPARALMHHLYKYHPHSVCSHSFLFMCPK